jgi:hypothetical protein
LGIVLILILQAHITNFGSQSSPSSYAQQSSSPPPSLQAVDPVQAEQDASQLADAFQHAFVGDNMDEDEDGTGDEGNRDREEDEDDEDNKMDVDDPVRAARTSAKAWVCNCHPYGYSHCLRMQM